MLLSEGLLSAKQRQKQAKSPMALSTTPEPRRSRPDFKAGRNLTLLPSSYEHSVTYCRCRLLSSRLLQFTSVTHIYVDYCSLTAPGGL